MEPDFTPDRDAHSLHSSPCMRTRHGLDAASSLHPVKLRPWSATYTALSARCHQSYFARYLRPMPIHRFRWRWVGVCGCAEPCRCSNVAGSWAPAPGAEWRCAALGCSSLTLWATVWLLLPHGHSLLQPSYTETRTYHETYVIRGIVSVSYYNM